VIAWLVIAGQVTVAATLALAAIAKFHDPASFRAALGLSPLTRRFRGPLVVAVPGVELGLAAALLLAPRAALPAMLVAAGLLLLAFAVWLGSVLAAGVQASCACFGPSDRPIGASSLVRNLALAAAAVGAAVAAGDGGAALADVEVLARAVLLTTAALLVALLIGLRRARPQLLLHRNDITEEGRA
jgi:hypothetical protein